MGGGPMTMALPALVKAGAGMMGGGGAASGGAAAAPAVSPFSAALMGGEGNDTLGAGGPPGAAGMLMKSPAARGVGQPPAASAGLIGSALNPEMSAAGKDQARLTNLDDISQVPGRSPFSRHVTAPPPADPDQPQMVKTQTVPGVPMEGGIMTRDPRARPASVFGKDVTGQNWQPSNGSVDLPVSGPVPAATNVVSPQTGGLPGAAPMPQRNPSFHDAPKPAPPFGEQQFDTAAPGPKTMGMFDSLLSGAQEKLKGIPKNPMAQTGLAFLQAGHDGSNPYAAMTKNLQSIPQLEMALRSSDIAQAASDRAGKKDADEASDAEIRRLMAQMLMLQGGGMPPQQGGVPIRQAEGQARAIR
jgi:hypothetical protein